MRLCCSCALIKLLAVLLIGQSAHAGITQYTDRDAWFEAVSPGGSVPITTIGFNEFPIGTVIRDQYDHLGVNFDGNNFTLGPGCSIYPEDCWGLRGLLPGIGFELHTPRNALAVDFPGNVEFDLFLDGVFVESAEFDVGGGTGNFGGIISSEEFNEVVINDPVLPPVNIDDLHFVAIPVPGSFATFVIVSLVCRHGRRRRRRIL